MNVHSPFQKECPIWGPAAGDQLLLRPVISSADVRPKGCREIALVPLARAAWAVAMQSAHARALLPALPWQLMWVTAGSRLVRWEVNMEWMLMLLQCAPHYIPRIVGLVQPRMWSPVCGRAR